MSRRYTADELAQVLAAHKAWLRGEPNYVRADLTDADLTGADLYGADLTDADLYGANLTRANLTRADLFGANLTRANLTGTDLFGADLYGANLTDANLSGADLTGANLTGANLTRANLTRANLIDANLTGATLPPFAIVPDEGAFVAFKLARGGRGRLLVRIAVPADAKRVSTPVGRKCRVSRAVVESITDIETGASVKCATSLHDASFSYMVGDTITPRDAFDDDIRVECTSGIHCFITKREALDYDR